MSFDGIWETSTSTPMGNQQGTLTLTTNGGGGLMGEMKSALGTDPIMDGKLVGDTATWTINMTKPMTMKLEFTVKVEGDNLVGTVKMGMFGSRPIEGKRI